jgi:hypothetical protein
MNEKSPFKNSLNFGLMTGIGLIIFAFVSWATGLQLTNKSMGWLSYIVLGAGIGLGIRNYRDKVLGGEISLVSAFQFGFFISVTASALAALFSFLLMEFIDPSMIDKIKQLAEIELNKQNLPADQLKRAIEMQNKFVSATFMSVANLIGYIITGAIISLIVAALIKKQTQQPLEQ